MMSILTTEELPSTAWLELFASSCKHCVFLEEYESKKGRRNVIVRLLADTNTTEVVEIIEILNREIYTGP